MTEKEFCLSDRVYWAELVVGSISCVCGLWGLGITNFGLAYTLLLLEDEDD